MLCLGGVYAWSILAAEFIRAYAYRAAQTQLIFGTLIAVFPLTMLIVGRIAARLRPRWLAVICGLLFLLGYLIAGLGSASFPVVLLGIGILGGVATGFGYWTFLTIPVRWFPQRSGLITGISVAGFGFGAVVLSSLAELHFAAGRDLSQFLLLIGLVYGLILILCANFIASPQDHSVRASNPNQQPIFQTLLSSPSFYPLFFGIFFGTFAGLMIIGNLKLIGAQFPITTSVLVMGVNLFSVANFLGRIGWGFLSDYLGATATLFLALLVQAVAIFLLGVLTLNETAYLLLSFVVGFGFGGNFVLFAKQTAQIYGTERLGLIYPYVFLGYAIAGIIGPPIGGGLYDFYGNFSVAASIASGVSLLGSLLFLFRLNWVKNLRLTQG